MEEQHLIQSLHAAITTNKNADNLIAKVNANFENSYILNYYAGVYYMERGNILKTEMHFNKSIAIAPLFSPPYFPLAEIYQNTNRAEEIEPLFLRILHKKTLDGPTRKYNYSDNLRICSILGPHYVSKNKSKKAIKLYKEMMDKMKEFDIKEWQPLHFTCWKNLCLSLGNLYMATETERAFATYRLGMLGKYKSHPELDKKLLQGLYIAQHYNIKNTQFDTGLINKLYVPSPCTRAMTSIGPIKLGYISPDFNKNAVGLFVTPLLKYFDPNKFEVHVYYTNSNSDTFTNVFKSYPNLEWHNCHALTNQELYKLVHDDHKIDILVDLIAHGIGGNVDFLAMAPAPMIINYLGYPGTMDLKTVTHRITDKIADPSKSALTEKFIYMPRCFLCYHLFDGIRLPEIKVPSGHGNKIHIGVMNKLSKHHEFVRDVYKSILSKNSNITLCIKLGPNETLDPELYKNMPIKVFEFTESLETYLEQYNELDLCLDTYPYSGTTTTCSSLIMGVPVITYYDPKNPHVSNVSASILKASQLDSYICSSWEQYKKKATCKNRDLEYRQRIRESFLRAMDPVAFMKDYEETLMLNTR
jgi:tetratricopeptide (TPR) repeat protein